MKSKKSFIGVLPLVLFTIVALSLVAIISLVKSPVWIPIMAAVSLVSLIVMVICYEIADCLIDVIKEIQITSKQNKNAIMDIAGEISNITETLGKLSSRVEGIASVVDDISSKDNGLPIGNPEDTEDTVSFYGLKNAIINNELVISKYIFELNNKLDKKKK